MTVSKDFCQRQGIAPEHFEAIAFNRALYPHARLLRGIVAFFQPEFFAIDREMVRAAGATASARDFRLEELEFHSHPENAGLLRRRLLLRISTRRLYQLLFPHGNRHRLSAPRLPLAMNRPASRR
ncbi:MAG TPA: hypothetical protein VGE76_06500 [Opitutaceae bacterium]